MNELMLKFLSFQEKASSWQFERLWPVPAFDRRGLKAAAHIIAPMPDPEVYEKARAKMIKKAGGDVPLQHLFMYKEPLLNAKQEHHMLRKYNYFKYKFKKLIDSNSNRKNVTNSLLIKLQFHYDELCKAKQQLVYSNARLVMHRVKANRVVDHDSGVSDGYLGLVRALDYFDWRMKNKDTGRPLKFSTYAFYAIQDSIRRNYYYDNRDFNLSMTNSDEVIDIVGSQEDDTSNAFELKGIVARCLKLVQARDREVLCMRFGLDGYKEHTLDEMGKVLNITKERVRQIQLRGLQKIRESGTVKYG